MKGRLSIIFVRRGYSPTGGAETYLKRLAGGVIEAGHDVRLVTTNDWPDADWPFGSITRVTAKSPIGFATDLERMRTELRYDALFSLERIWSCDVYRAGDGVHRAWLDRRREFEPFGQRIVRRFSRKHEGLLRLRKMLFAIRTAGRVLV